MVLSTTLRRGNDFLRGKWADWPDLNIQEEHEKKKEEKFFFGVPGGQKI
jgi:hypothetical protein